MVIIELLAVLRDESQHTYKKMKKPGAKGLLSEGKRRNFLPKSEEYVTALESDFLQMIVWGVTSRFFSEEELKKSTGENGSSLIRLSNL
jgi:hypothetical protein